MKKNTLPRKERERLARREEILAAARTVFAERGFEKATLDEISEVAEFGKGTIYNYFASKEELFASVLQQGIQHFQKFVAGAVQRQDTPRTKIEAYIDAAFEFFEKHRQIFSILVLERNKLASSMDEALFQKCCQQQEAVIDYLAQLFKEGVRHGTFRKLEPQRLAQALFGQIHLTIFNAIRDPEGADFKKETKFIKGLFFEGLILPDAGH